MGYSLNELREWNEKIESIALNFGLDFYPQEYEIVDYEDMIACETYLGMPSQYPHWSFGKNYERIKTFYKYNLVGLPYEMVINSNPCIAYLMKDNTLLLQVLTMAHVYGHNDFFKNNRLFKEGTHAKYTVEMFKNHGSRVRKYIQDPKIGYTEVEKILDAAHAVKLQINRMIGNNKKDEEKYPQEDILLFIRDYGKLEEWQRDLLTIVMEETKYFLPQIETKIMNEGWASFWHYKILHKLDLPQKMEIEFISRHNMVLRPHLGGINPYHLGFHLFESIEKKYGIEKIFKVREIERDASFIMKYLDQKNCKDLNLFEYMKRGRDYVVEEIGDENGYKKIRNHLAGSTGLGRIPVIKVIDVNQKDGTLILEHEFDGRELNFEYAYETLKYIVTLWGGKVILNTSLSNIPKIILCDEDRYIIVKDGERK